MQPILIDGKWSVASDPVGSISAEDPATGESLGDAYPISSWPEIERALRAGAEAAPALAAASPKQLSDFLHATASAIELREDALVEVASRETGLPDSPRLRKVELPRTTNQLRHIARCCVDGSFREAVVDTKLNIRSCYEPLGAPVVVLGPNNFPFAFNAIAGGDFAAALAAGNPVIGKAHPDHPGTTRLLAEAAFEALAQSGLPKAAVQMLYHFEAEDGCRLAAHPATGAVAFTGSRQAGLALKAAADAAGKPIYLELSSINPMFLLPGALAERPAELPTELAGSCTLAAGQFCTNPGLSVVVDGPTAHEFVDGLAAALREAPNSTLLAKGVLSNVEAGVSRLQTAGAELLLGGSALPGPGYRFENTLLRVSGSAFCRSSELQGEVFGPVHMVVVVKDFEEMLNVARSLEGNLTGCIYSSTQGTDDTCYQHLAAVLTPKVGRLLNDKVPTGVAVTEAMQHGGPFPATGHPGFSSVGGMAALRRFTALRCYDNVREERLPAALRSDNPLNLWRRVDGGWVRG